ncbi:MAG: 4-alpha-glucanotransferase, partial [Candidatus Omnitrophica bacterium]|nr:4-alpha-glucanotransferase [Candidatus Omnitrophota bacterium]
ILENVFISLMHKRSGILLALFSIYSRHSDGIGDFTDLKLAIDWCSITGNSILQLLPMNETGLSFCPYDAISSFGLEPLYLSLRELPFENNSSVESKIARLKKDFPTGKTFLDYEVKFEKIQALWDIFVQWDRYDSLELKKFRKDNSYWLEDFSLYKVLKKYHAGRPWFDWKVQYRNREKLALENFHIEHEKEITFECWLQWQLFRQFQEVKKYAGKKKILLKGDLPILVARDSADVWAHPEFFKLDFAAGAPADMYCAKGQRWGASTYDWENIARYDYQYLKEKLAFAQNFYDILRVDHVVGLFRIWSIPYREPLENKGLNGFFDPKDEALWREHGRRILKVMQDATTMQLCAEDLGVIPKACTETLRELGIPGNDVQRWVKDWSVRHDFLGPKEYRELSVAMLSTHDTTNWPAWWENEAGTVDEDLFLRKCNERGIDFLKVKPELFDLSCSCHGRLRWLNTIDSVDKLTWILGKKKEEVGDFIDLYLNSYQEKEKLWKQLGIKGQMREKCDAEILRAALKLSLDSSAIFCINNIFDWLYLSDILTGDPYQYRINTPGTISPKNWSLQLPIALEDLLKHKVSKEIHKMVRESGRCQ